MEPNDIERVYELMERPANLPADIPWYGRPYNSDDPLNPYACDGSMSAEDYELMHRNMASARILGSGTVEEPVWHLAKIIEPIVTVLKKGVGGREE